MRSSQPAKEVHGDEVARDAWRWLAGSVGALHLWGPAICRQTLQSADMPRILQQVRLCHGTSLTGRMRPARRLAAGNPLGRASRCRAQQLDLPAMIADDGTDLLCLGRVVSQARVDLRLVGLQEGGLLAPGDLIEQGGPA